MRTQHTLGSYCKVPKVCYKNLTHFGYFSMSVMFVDSLWVVLRNAQSVVEHLSHFRYLLPHFELTQLYSLVALEHSTRTLNVPSIDIPMLHVHNLAYWFDKISPFLVYRVSKCFILSEWFRECSFESVGGGAEDGGQARAARSTRINDSDSGLASTRIWFNEPGTEKWRHQVCYSLIVACATLIDTSCESVTLTLVSLTISSNICLCCHWRTYNFNTRIYNIYTK